MTENEIPEEYLKRCRITENGQTVHLVEEFHALVAVEMARKEQFSICKEILLESDKNWINQMQKDRQDMAEIINGEKNETALLIFQKVKEKAVHYCNDCEMEAGAKCESNMHDTHWSIDLDDVEEFKARFLGKKGEVKP